VIIFYVLLALVVVRTIALLVFIIAIAHPVSACPACFDQTVAIRNPWLFVARKWLEARWCPHCGWQGMARRAPRRSKPAPADTNVRNVSRH
jgi:hypothetical protein